MKVWLSPIQQMEKTKFSQQPRGSKKGWKWDSNWVLGLLRFACLKRRWIMPDMIRGISCLQLRQGYHFRGSTAYLVWPLVCLSSVYCDDGDVWELTLPGFFSSTWCFHGRSHDEAWVETESRLRVDAGCTGIHQGQSTCVCWLFARKSPIKWHAKQGSHLNGYWTISIHWASRGPLYVSSLLLNPV